MPQKERKTPHNIAVWHITHLHDPESRSFDHHCHGMYELLYVVSGTGRFVVEGAEYPMLPNTLLLVHPYDFHHVCPDNGSVYERYVVNFSESFVESLVKLLPMLQRGDGKGLYFVSEELTSDLKRSFSDLIACAELFHAPQDLRRVAMQQALLSRILLLLSVSRPNCPELNAPMTERVMSYVNRHLSEDLNLEEIARRFFVSKYHLCRSFREHAGISLFTYINTKRIIRARQLLAGGISATEAAAQVGFKSYSSFYRAFFKQMGYSPSEVTRDMRDGALIAVEWEE